MLHNVLPRQLPSVGRERVDAALADRGHRPIAGRRPVGRRVAGAVGRARGRSTRCARGRAPRSISSLAVGPRGRDGYHELDRSSCGSAWPTSWPSRLATAAASDALTVTGLPDCPVEGNLVLRALAAAPCATRSGRSCRRSPPTWTSASRWPPVWAAAVPTPPRPSTARSRLGRRPVARRARRAGARLGADVPFFAHDRAPRSSAGIGERLEPLAASGNPGLPLVTPASASRRPQVFARFDELDPAKPARPSTTCGRPTLPTSPSRRPDLRDANDLWPAAVAVGGRARGCGTSWSA